MDERENRGSGTRRMYTGLIPKDKNTVDFPFRVILDHTEKRELSLFVECESIIANPDGYGYPFDNPFQKGCLFLFVRHSFDPNR
jgi:hypothetical protein